MSRRNVRIPLLLLYLDQRRGVRDQDVVLAPPHDILRQVHTGRVLDLGQSLGHGHLAQVAADSGVRHDFVAPVELD